MMKRIFLAALFSVAAILAASMPPYDKNADPFKELASAKKEAKASGKRILLIAGGPWCDWCARFDDFITKDSELAGLASKYYVIMKVYVDRDFTPNGIFMAKFPTPPGFPHLYILNGEGELLVSQKTDLLEKGDSYDKVKVRTFLIENAPKK